MDQPKLPKKLSEPIDWRVTVRHTELKRKSRLVQALSRQDAWAKFLEDSAAGITPEEYGTKPEGKKWAERAKTWLKNNTAIPSDAEILPEAFIQERREWMRVKADTTGRIPEPKVPDYAKA